MSTNKVICCIERMYADKYRMLRQFQTASYSLETIDKVCENVLRSWDSNEREFEALLV